MKLGVRKYKKILKAIKQLYDDMGAIEVDWIYELCYMIDEPDSELVFEVLKQGEKDQLIHWEILSPHLHRIIYMEF